jgi:hypothetical protein
MALRLSGRVGTRAHRRCLTAIKERSADWTDARALPWEARVTWEAREARVRSDIRLELRLNITAIAEEVC